MYGYSQPADYRFSHDSIELAQRVAAILHKNAGAPVRILDLCAGCGVVGLEIARILPGARLAIDFNEIQGLYRPHFEANYEWIRGSREKRQPGASLEIRWLEMNYEDLLGPEFSDLYDLVVANPPYFDREHGSRPPSDFKARCRFFLDSDFTTLWRVVRHVLKLEGEAYILVRDQTNHGSDRETTLRTVLSDFGEWQGLDPIRGTGLTRFRKKPAAPRSSQF